MRILVATWHQQVVGGTETYLRELLPGLAERGHELALAVEHPAETGVPTIAAKTSMPTWVLTGNGVDEAFREIAAWEPDVCFVQGLQDPAIESGLARCFPSVLFAHNYHGTCVSGNKRFRFPSLQPCERSFGLGCLLCYLPRRCGGRNPLRMFSAYRREAARNRLLGQYRAVAVASRHMADEFARHGVGPDRLELIPLFPSGQTPDSAPPAFRSQTGRLLFVGRLVENKGTEHAVRAAALAMEYLGRTLSLDVAGDGADRPRMQLLAKQLGVPVNFHGWLAPERRNQLMRDADLLVLASTWPEPFGLVGVEAACVGLPAAGFAVGGIPDWLEPGVSGESANGSPPSPQELARAMERCLRDQQHWQQLRVGAWKMAGRFTLAAHLDALEAVLASACKLTTPMPVSP